MCLWNQYWYNHVQQEYKNILVQGSIQLDCTTYKGNHKAYYCTALQHLYDQEQYKKQQREREADSLHPEPPQPLTRITMLSRLHASQCQMTSTHQTRAYSHLRRGRRLRAPPAAGPGNILGGGFTVADKKEGPRLSQPSFPNTSLPQHLLRRDSRGVVGVLLCVVLLSNDQAQQKRMKHCCSETTAGALWVTRRVETGLGRRWGVERENEAQGALGATTH